MRGGREGRGRGERKESAAVTKILNRFVLVNDHSM